MVFYYTLIKNLHIMLALVSVALFTYRWLSSFCASAGMQSKFLKVLPHLNDTLLLLTGVVLIAIFIFWSAPNYIINKLVFFNIKH